MKKRDLDDLAVCSLLVDTLSQNQDSIDTLLSNVSGKWWFDCDCDCETEHVRMALLLIVRYVFGRVILSDQIDDDARRRCELIHGLSFLMIESNVFEHYSTFREQDEYERPYAMNWILLGELAGGLRKLINSTRTTGVKPTIDEVFETYGTRRT